MSGAKRTWIAFAAAAALEIAALAPTAAIAAPLAARDGGARSALPDATPLTRFYPAPLLSTPGNGVEDQDVWLAKVRGLMAGAPALLQQSLLASQNAQDFSANLALLQQMQEGMLKQAGLQLQMLAKPGAAGTKVLGSSNNLVYTALNPCRIMDTRNAAGASGVQGPLAGNTLYHIPGYVTVGTNWSLYGQTGTLSDCGLTSAVGGNIYAVAIVITVLNPNFDAFLGVSQSSVLATTLSTVAVNFTHGQGISTLYIVPQTSTNTIYFAMPAGLSGDVIFDVVGYFSRSEATALDCTNTAETIVAIGASGGSTFASPPACATGYTPVTTVCYADSYLVSLVATNGDCAYRNTDSVAHNIRASSRCCRVPGR